jgi:hypothetical protein
MLELSTDARTAVAVVLFALSYVGMAAGRVPWLTLDRTGIALIAAITVVAPGVLPVDARAPACRSRWSRWRLPAFGSTPSA